MSKAERTPIPLIDHIAPLAATSTVWFADIWGVMHNGIQPFATAVSACRQFRAAGGTVLLLSNAPRPAASVAQQLDRIGVDGETYDAIVSSGDAVRSLITVAAARGQSVGHLGPERDLGIYQGLDVIRTPLDVADVVVCTGLFDDETETAEDYRASLAVMVQHGRRMICANPDLTVERGGRIVFCAGAIAAVYEDLGGVVDYAGKPHLPIYDMALARASELRGHPVSVDRILAIGDGIRTDIAGAHAAGIRSVFIASGVHVEGDRPLDAAILARLFPHDAPRPLAAMAALAW